MLRDTAIVPALLAFVAGAFFFWWIYYRREFAVSSRGLLLSLRTLALLGIVALLWNPGLTLGAGGTAPRFVLLDGSASMSALGAGGEPIWTEAVQRARALAGDADTRILLAGETPRALAADALEQTTPTAERSSWLEGLRTAAEAGAREVVLLSDRRFDDPLSGAELARQLGLDVVVESLPEAGPNRGISRLSVPATVEGGVAVEGRVELQGAWDGDAVRVDIEVDGDSVATVMVPAPVQDGTTSGSFVLADGLTAGLHELTAVLPGTDSYAGDDRRSRLVSVDPEETGVLLVSFRPDWEARFLFPVLSQATGLPARGYVKVGEDRYLPLHPGASSSVDEQALSRMMARAELLVAMGVDGASVPLVEASWSRSGRILLFPADAEAAALAGVGTGAALTGEWYVEEPPASPIAGVLGDFQFAGLPPLTRVLPVVDDGGGQALGVRLGGAGRPEAALVLRQLGSRRIAVALARGFWRWGFRDGAPRDRYRRLWSAVGGWMLADEPLAAGPGVRPAEPVLARGARVPWQAWGYEGDTVQVQISSGDGPPLLDSALVVPQSGGFETDVLPPGRYAFRSLLEADTTRGEFVVESFSGDMLRRAVDPTVLAVEVEEGAGVQTAPPTRPLRTSSWPYLFVLGLLCGEWTLRRRAGLR